MTDRVNPAITRIVMIQFELLSRSNTVNMLNTPAVYRQASIIGYKELAALIDSNVHAYVEILTRRDFYLRKFKLKRE